MFGFDFRSIEHLRLQTPESVCWIDNEAFSNAKLTCKLVVHIVQDDMPCELLEQPTAAVLMQGVVWTNWGSTIMGLFIVGCQVMLLSD